MLTTLRQVFRLVGRDHPGRWVLLAVFAVIASGFEMLGAILVYILLGLVVDPQASVDVPLLGDLRTLVGDVAQDRLLVSVAIAMALFFVLRGLVHVGVTYAQQRVAHNAGARLASHLVEGYLEWPYAVHLHRNSSELIRNAHQAVQHLVEQVFLPLIRVGAEAVLMVGFLVLLIAISPLATGLAVFVVGGAAAALALVIQPRLKRIGITAHEMAQRTLGSLQQSLHGIRDIKLLGKEQYFSRQYRTSRLNLAHASYLHAAANELPRAVIETALMGFILLFFVVTILVGGQGQTALSTLGLFAYAGLRLQPSLQRILAGLNNLKYATAPLNDLDADLRAVEALPRSDRSVDAIPFKDSLILQSVAFRYPGEPIDALRDINLRVRPGEQLGICGPTGGGKTTLVDLVTGLLHPTSGRVTVDGYDLRDHSRAWQRNLGVVPQMVFFVDDTLRRNIALGVRDPEIDENAIDEAIELAQLRDFVESLPTGLDTVVGERGIRISGGERQRLAIARALYRRPKVLIFDEGTSALDQATETSLMAAIDRLRGDRTIILIAHRLSTVRSSDRILFVEGGTITGLGTYEQLRRDHATFRTMSR